MKAQGIICHYLLPKDSYLQTSRANVMFCDVVVLDATSMETLKEDQPLRLLLNLLFYHFNRSEPTYKSQHIKLLDVIAACNQLNVNALN